MNQARWVLLGGDTLVGKELRDLVTERKLPVTLALVSSSQSDRILTEEEGDLSVMEPLEPETLEGASVLLLAGAAEANRAALEMAKHLTPVPTVLDLTGQFEDAPESRLRAPLLENGRTEAFPPLTIHSVIHPAAAALSRLLWLLHPALEIRASVVNVFEPVSAHGKDGIDELHQQTLNLFSFQPLPKKVFDAQVSFNLLPRFGEDATEPVASGEQRMERHIASFLGRYGVPLPSVRVMHAPVFHGYCQSIWLEFAETPSVEKIEEILREGGVDVRDSSMEPGSNVGVAGQSGLIVSDIALDRSHPRAAWIWLASDNLRTIVDNALLVAAMASRPQGGEAK